MIKPRASVNRPVWAFKYIFCLTTALIFFTYNVQSMDQATIKTLRQESVELFYHGYDNYLRYAFPEDELRPLTCGALFRDRENPAHIELNDALGNYSLTLIDSLSTLAILASSPDAKRKPKGWLTIATTPLEDFQDGIKLLVEYYGDGTSGTSGEGKKARGFDLDSKVQVFETVIRGVGGLLSAHLFAVGDLPIRGYGPVSEIKHGQEGIHWRNGLVYDGQLLRLAQDLADRLVPAFYTPTDLPYPRVNLRHGVPFYPNSPYNADSDTGMCAKQSTRQEITETCSAGAGSLVLEFTTLSRLTGNSLYEKLAKQAFYAVWNRRSSLGLIGSGIDSESGDWVTSITGIGAGIDSFFEYAFKSHVLLSNLPVDANEYDIHPSDEFLETWQEAHSSIKRHVYRGDILQHPHYAQVDMNTGAAKYWWVDSLSAFYPGLLTLSGELDEAITVHLLYTALWTRYSAMPERWSTYTGEIESGLRWWGGRPEFIESSWYLYRATNDPWYLHVGEMALRDIKRRCWTKCGWSGLQDVRTGEKSDRMESFFLGETAKYLFLLFDVDHPLNSLDAPFVFTTEGHPLIIPKRVIPQQSRYVIPIRFARRTNRAIDTAMCSTPPPFVPFSLSPTAARDDIFHAASLARLDLMPAIEEKESPLVEFNEHHPSVSIADIRSPSNYTYFPWTLPMELIPQNGFCSKIAAKSTFDLSFPNFPEVSSPLLPITRLTQGLLINTMSGLRLGMVKEPLLSHDFGLGDVLRIHSITGITLGRDERVFVSRETVSTINAVDPFFTRIRDSKLLDVLVDVEASEYMKSKNSTKLDDVSVESLVQDLNIDLDSLKQARSGGESPFLSSLLKTLQSILRNPIPTATAEQDEHELLLNRHVLTASIPTGPGSAPLASLDTEPPVLSDSMTESPFEWGSIYISPHDLCEEVLPSEIPREYQVIIVRRGGCSFSTKLQHIPVFPPSSKSLQLVIVVSYPGSSRPLGSRRDLPEERIDSSDPTEIEMVDEDWGLIQPYLDVEQLSPAGIPRPHPIPMIMLYGGGGSMNLLTKAKGIALRRRWWFESQGLRINNLIVL
jgi:Glycosyl hydrolase family 47